jgi:hypothetical protein
MNVVPPIQLSLGTAEISVAGPQGATTRPIRNIKARPTTDGPLSFLDQMSGMSWQEGVKDQLALRKRIWMRERLRSRAVKAEYRSSDWSFGCGDLENISHHVSSSVSVMGSVRCCGRG